MKNVKLLTRLLFVAILFTACSNDDDAPTPVNEEEVITTLTVKLIPSGGGSEISMIYRDLDGPDGPNDPVITTTSDLATGITYNGTIRVENETESPAENITEEVEEEDLEHQFFYTPGGGLSVTSTYSNFDADGNPLGTQFTLTAGAASSGTLTFTLRHEPTKPNSGLSDAGGETDISATFDVTVQ